MRKEKDFGHGFYTYIVEEYPLTFKDAEFGILERNVGK